MLMQSVVDHLATLLLVDLQATLLIVGAEVVLRVIHLNGAGTDLTLLTIGGGGLTPLIIAGVDHTHLTTVGAVLILVPVPLIVGLQMTAAIGGVTVLTLHMTPDMMTVTIGGVIDHTLHMTPNTMTVTIGGVTVHTLHLSHRMADTMEGTVIVQFPEVLHRRKGEALGGAIHVVLAPNGGLTQEARGGATLRVYPQGLGRVFPVGGHPSGVTLEGATLGALLGAQVQVLDLSQDLLALGLLHRNHHKMNLTVLCIRAVLYRYLAVQASFCICGSLFFSLFFSYAVT